MDYHTTIPRHIILQTIANNLLHAGVIKPDKVDYTKRLYNQYGERELLESLLESHMLNPLNLPTHEVGYMSDN